MKMKNFKPQLKRSNFSILILGFLLLAFNLSAQVNLSNGLVAYYPLDNNRLDYSGNANNGTAAGGTGFTTDRLGNPNSAASFGGTANPGKITILPSASLTFSTGVTFAFWARVNSAVGTLGNGNTATGGFHSLFAKAGDAGGGFWQLASFSSNILENRIGNNASPNLMGAISPYTLGEWFHYVVTMDASGHSIYVNGVLQSSNTDAANLAAMTTRNLVLGRFNSNWYPLNGSVDEFRVYNRVINNDEIQALLEDDLASIQVSISGATTYCAGDQVLVDYTSIGQFAAGNVFNVQLSDANGSFANPSVISQFVSSDNTGTFSVTLPEILSTSSSYRFRVVSSAPFAISDTTAFISVTGILHAIPDPALYNYVGSVGGNHYYLSTNQLSWQQAQLQAQSNGGHLAVIPNAQTNSLLANALPTGFAYIGLTDEITEGTFLWVDGTPLSYTNWNPGEPNNAGGGEDYVAISNTGTWNDTPGGNGFSFLQLSTAGINQTLCSGATIQLNASSVSGANYSWTGPNGFLSTQQNPSITNATGINSGVYHLEIESLGCSAFDEVSIVINQAPSNLGQSSPLLSSLTNDLVLYYPMNGDATDASGNSLDGTVTGGVIPMNDRFGNVNSALQFNGVNGFIDVPDGVFFNGSDFTVSAWVRKVSNNSWSRLFDFGIGQANENVLVAISNGTTGRPTSQMYNGTVGGAQVSSPTVALTNNKWELLTYTWSNGNGVLYINGIQRGQGAQTAPNNVIRTINYIGRSNWPTDTYANAGFDDFRIYNKLLNSAEIQSIMMEQQNALSATVTSGSICNGTTAQIALAHSQLGVTYQLQNAITSVNVGAAQGGTGDTLFFTTGALTDTTDFKFTATVTSGCNTTLTPNITVIVQPIPTAPIGTNDTVCNSGIMTIGVSGGSSYNWYTVPTGGTPSTTITGNSYTTPNTNVTENYYVSLIDGFGCESARTPVSAVVINPLNPPVDIINGLILHYKFDGDLMDYSGNSYNATITGTNSYVNDRNGNVTSAINSTATGSPGSNFISAGNPAKVQQLTNQVTFSMWIRQTQTWFGSSGTDGQMPLINKWNGSTGMWIGLRMQNPTNMSNRVRWRVNGTTFIESNTNVPVGTWHHVVCTYNGAQLRIYQNGVLTGTLNHTGGIANTAQDLMLGRQANGMPSDGITYRGDWDEVKLFNRALNQSEIQTLFNNESVAFATSPLCDGEGDLSLTTFEFPGATYLWNGPNGFTSTLQNPPVIVNADSATYAGLYTLQVTAQGCASPLQNVNAVIYQIPLAPVTINDTVCGSGNAVLTAQGAPTGASYLWYTLPTGGTPISGQTGSTLTLSNLSATIQRYVSIIRNGCEGPRSEVTAFYFSNVLDDLVVNGSQICAGSSTASVSVIGSESGVNYQVFMGLNPISSIVVGGGNISIPVNTTGMTVGNTTVTIQATQSGCGSVNLINLANIIILATPIVDITASGSLSFCSGDNVTLTATNAVNYLWSNGATAQSILVDQTGSFSVTITDANGCEATSSIVHTTENASPVPMISANGPLEFCSGGQVELVASGGSSYLWSNGATAPSIIVTQAGLYNFTAYNGTCEALSSGILVSVFSVPVVSSQATQTEVCFGESIVLTGNGAVTYTWDNGVVDGVGFAPTNTGIYTVTGTDGNGCSAQASTLITVNQLPDATFTPSALSFCPGIASMDLVASVTNYTTYNWFENGSPLQLNGSFTQVITAPGAYELEVVDHNGCVNTSGLNIGVESAPIVSISAANTSFCAGDSEPITATFEAGASYTWYENGNLISGPSPNNTLNVISTGEYSVVLTNSNGCEGLSNSLIIEMDDPLNTSEISGATAVECSAVNENYSVLNTVNSTYFWTVPIGAAILNGQGTNAISVSFNGSFGTISVIETNALGCQGDEKQIVVDCDNLSLNELTKTVLQVFPNPTSDYFVISFGNDQQVGALKIYDSFGKIVHSVSIISNDVINIEHLAKGIYHGVLEVVDQEHEFKVIKQ